MKWRVICLIGAAIFFCSAAYAEIAILPYKINNSSNEFPEQWGGQYSRLLAVAALTVKENVEIASPREIDADLERMKLSSQEVISGDDLDLLGKTRRFDFFLLGSLTKKKDGFRSESVLYSVRDHQVIIKIRVEGNDLFALAEKEVREALVRYRNRPIRREAASTTAMDALFLLDVSYGVNREWDSIKNAIMAFSGNLIDTMRMDTRIYIVPFSDRSSYPSSSVSMNSVVSVRSELDKLKPAGGADSENFIKSLKYATQSIRWRSDARRVIIILSNSSVSSRVGEKYAIIARKKDISMYSISLGAIPGDRSELLERLANISNGVHVHAAYHQKCFNAAAEPEELYMENGRFFKSQFYDGDWKKGLHEPGMSKRVHSKPKRFLDELFIDEKRIPATPYTMSQVYERISMNRIISQENLENNIDSIMNRISAASLKKASKHSKNIGKALVSDGSVSFWITVSDEEYMNYFETRQKTNYIAPLGIMVKKDTGTAYGLSIVPLVKGVSLDYIPELARTTLGDIVKRSDYYMLKGLFYPPVWFVSVKVDVAERFRSKEDIRER